jgi:ABC-type microcin C transport system permease subunit YejB
MNSQHKEFEANLRRKYLDAMLLVAGFVLLLFAYVFEASALGTVFFFLGGVGVLGGVWVMKYDQHLAMKEHARASERRTERDLNS